jgi:hypothetical protein
MNSKSPATAGLLWIQPPVSNFQSSLPETSLASRADTGRPFCAFTQAAAETHKETTRTSEVENDHLPDLDVGLPALVMVCEPP